MKENGTSRNTSNPDAIICKDMRLAAIAKAWSELPDAVRQAIWLIIKQH